MLVCVFVCLCMHVLLLVLVFVCVCVLLYFCGLCIACVVHSAIQALTPQSHPHASLLLTTLE